MISVVYTQSAEARQAQTQARAIVNTWHRMVPLSENQREWIAALRLIAERYLTHAPDGRLMCCYCCIGPISDLKLMHASECPVPMAQVALARMLESIDELMQRDDVSFYSEPMNKLAAKLLTELVGISQSDAWDDVRRRGAQACIESLVELW